MQRLANPLINEAIIGTKDKDRWNATDPNEEEQFLDYYRNPRLALALQLVFGVPRTRRDATTWSTCSCGTVPASQALAELLRLDLSVPPTPLAQQRRMTVLATPADPAGWPNGRRPKDDVTDIAVRVVGGANFVAARRRRREPQLQRAIGPIPVPRHAAGRAQPQA